MTYSVPSPAARRVRHGFLLFTMAGCAAARALAADTTLLLDNFNAATGNTTDLNVALARETGLAAPVTYAMAGGPGHYGHQLQNPNALNQLLVADFANSTVSPNLNFNGIQSAGGLRISFDMDSVPTVYGGTPDNWGCINLGLTQANQLANVNDSVPHFGVLFRANGFLQAFDGNMGITPVEPQYSTQPPGTFNHIDIIITDADGNPFDGTGNTVIDIYANGGGSPVYSFTKVGGFADNYINLQGSFRAHVDNFTVARRDALSLPTIVNPSFEVNTFTAWPGYVVDNTAITGWASLGNHGLNPVAPFGPGDSPFADNGAIPNGTKVAFMQGDGALRQTVSGFTRGGVYRLRYSENARNGPLPGSFASVGGILVVPQHNVGQVGGANPYTTVLSQPFIAAGTSMEIAITKNNPNGGDTTLLIDNVSLEAATPTVPLVANPSFEVDTFNTFPGYAEQGGNGPITGWSPAVASLGLNGPGMGAGTAFADNGAIPDGAKVCFIQGAGLSIRQTVGPFTVGSAYVVRYYENARNCCGGSPGTEVRIGGNVIVAAHAVPAVGGANPYTLTTSSAFVATAGFMELLFTKSDAVAGDSTLVLDAVSIAAAPTLITQQPRSTCALPGETVTLTVGAVGPPPLTYQWRKNGIDIMSATSPTLTLNNVTEADTGGYSVFVTSSAGNVTSSTAKVVVGQVIPSVYGTGTDNDGALLAAGSVDPHYRLQASADPAFPGPNAIVLSEAFPIPPWRANGPLSKWIAPNDTSGNAIPGDYTYRLTFNLSNYDPANTVLCGQWTSDNGGVNILINGTPTGQTTSGDFGTFFPFVIDSGFVAGMNTLDFVVNNAPPAGPTGLRVDATGIALPLAGIAPSISRQPRDTIGVVGSPSTFAVVAAGSTPLSYQWYRGATLLPGATSPTLTVNVTGAPEQGLYSVLVSNTTSTVTSRQATLTVRQRVPGLFNTGVDNTPAVLPDAAVDPHYTIVVNPDSASPNAIVQNSAAFPIVAGPWLANNASSKWIGPRFDTTAAAGLATGGGIYVYRLSFDLTGLDNSTVVITGGWATDNPGLDIRVNGTGTGQASAGFGALSAFTLNSGNATFTPGINTLEFVVRNEDAVAGYTGLRVENLLGFVTLPSTPPSISAQPQGRTAGTGESVTFSVTASGSSPLIYQWRKGGTDLMGANGTTLTLNNLQHTDAGVYSVVVSNLYGSATSANATLIVRDTVPGLFNTGVNDSRVALPDGTVDPHYKLVVNPDAASMNALVQDSTVFPIVAGPWVANDAAGKWIGPRTETSAAAGGDSPGGDYTYRLTVDLTGFDLSSIEITGEWATDNAGLDILFNGSSTGQPNTVQFVGYTPFRLTNGFLAGPNTIDFKLNNAAAGYTGLRVRNLRGLATALPPGTAPFIIQQPQGVLANYGDTATFTVRANGSAPIAYQWLYEGFEIFGATSASYGVLVDFPDVAGRYSVRISNGAGLVTSANALLTINNPPAIPPKGGATPMDTPVAFPASKLLFGVTDPDGDTFTLQSVSTTSLQGGTIMTNATGYVYTPAAGFTGTDTFEFVVRDSRGGVSTGTMEMLMVSGALPTQNMVVMMPVPGGVLVRFAGIPGRAYQIQRSTDLLAWTTLVTRTVPAHGILEYVDTTPPPGQAFYRTQAAP